MKKIHTFGILLMMILLGSCISSQAGFTNEQLLSIRKGMTLEQVTDVLGSPSYRTFRGGVGVSGLRIFRLVCS